MTDTAAVAPVEDWEVIFEPFAVIVVESIHGRNPEAGTVELQLERYESEAGLLRECKSEGDVIQALKEIGASDAKARAYAPRLWGAMEDYLKNGPSSSPTG